MRNKRFLILAAIALATLPAIMSCDGFSLNPSSTTVVCYLDSVNDDRGYITGNGAYSVGDTVTMEAVAHDGYIFTNWYMTSSEGALDLLTNATNLNQLDEDDLDSLAGLYSEDETANPYVFVAKENIYYFMANFIDTADRHSIHIAVEPLSLTEGTGDYELFSTQQIAARDTQVAVGGQAVGVAFRKWHDGNTDTPRAITVSHQRTYLAIYDTVTSGAR